MKRLEESIATYEKACKFAKKHLGEEHSLSQNLDNVLRNALEGKENTEKKTCTFQEPKSNSHFSGKDEN